MSAAEEVSRAVARFRAQNNAEPGQVWDPGTGRYRTGTLEAFAGSDVGTSYKSGIKCQAVASAPYVPNVRGDQPLAREACGCRTCSAELEDLSERRNRLPPAADRA